MTPSLCIKCLNIGYCPNVKTRRVNGENLTPAFIHDLRGFTASLPVNFRQWRDYLANEYRDYPGMIVDADGQEVFLNMSVFELPNIEYWFRDFACTPCSPSITPRLRVEACERVQVMATILRARNPQAAAFWGRMNAANDNEPSE